MRPSIVPPVIRLALLCCLNACAHSVGQSSGPHPRSSSSDASVALPAIMQEMASAWNRADLGAHVRPYADSATMMGRPLLVGRPVIESALRRAFWVDGKPVQQLRFDDIVVRPLGKSHGLLTGTFVLSGGNLPNRSGVYSLIWEMRGGRWQIIHDHSG